MYKPLPNFITITVLASVLFVTACGELTEPQPLRTVEIPFSGESVMGSIKGEEYRYFRYPSVEAALVDKAKISSDGTLIAGKQFLWEGPVHIYHLAKRIVIYVGDTPDALSVIEKNFGPQIAGDAVAEEGEDD